MIKFVIFEGVDCCGKTTTIDTVINNKALKIEAESKGLLGFKVISFPRRTPGGNRIIHDSESIIISLLESFKLFDPRYIYVLDRFLLSNVVYDGVLRRKDNIVSKYWHNNFINSDSFEILEVFLTNNFRGDIDYVDEHIKLSADQYNAIISEYITIANNTGNTVYNVINNPDDKSKLLSDIRRFISYSEPVK